MRSLPGAHDINSLLGNEEGSTEHAAVVAAVNATTMVALGSASAVVGSALVAAVCAGGAAVVRGLKVTAIAGAVTGTATLGVVGFMKAKRAWKARQERKAFRESGPFPFEQAFADASDGEVEIPVEEAAQEAESVGVTDHDRQTNAEVAENYRSGRMRKFRGPNGTRVVYTG